MTTDRDGSIERLLRRALPPDPHAPERDCPDAETLAALADDTLTAGARREVEGHIADCHRCQAMTAAMVRADVPTGTRADEAAGEAPAWRRRAFNWLVPAAAAATAVALWVLVPGQRPPLPEEPVAERQVVAPPPLSSEVITSEPLKLPDDSRADSAAAERDANVPLEKAVPPAPPVSAPPEASRRSFEASADDRDQAARQESVAVRPETAAAPQERRLGDAAAPAPPPPAAIGATASAALQRAPTGFDVVSPDARIRWRVGPGPLVQYSADGGATWAAQQTGASAELTAGSAPTPAVCWLVGRGGLIMRTTNGGRQWERVAFPETVDLNAVTASTALNAIVDLADGRRLATTDGGRTWTPVRN